MGVSFYLGFISPLGSGLVYTSSYDIILCYEIMDPRGRGMIAVL